MIFFKFIYRYASEIIAGLILDHCNKANVTIKQVTRIIVFPVHIKVFNSIRSKNAMYIP